jgi:hypothetical protein
MTGPDTEKFRRDWVTAQDYIASRQKVFVVGCAKSGTTWMMNLLNGHPQMVVKGEGRFTWRMVPFLAQAFKAFNEDQVKHCSDASTYLRDIDLLLCARQLIDITLFRYVETSGKQALSVSVVGDKTPQHAISIPMLNEIYPGAKFIHILRDPRDAAASGWHHFGPDSKKEREDYLCYFVREVWPLSVLTAREASKTIPGQYLELRYEDLHREEPYQVRRCLDFLGVDASPTAIEACMAEGDFKKRSNGRERGVADPKAFYRRGVTGDWVNHLSPERAAAFCAPVADLMRSCGYDPVAGLTPGVQVNVVHPQHQERRAEAA